MNNVIEFPTRQTNLGVESLAQCDCTELDDEFKGWAVLTVNHVKGAFITRIVCMNCKRQLIFDAGVFVDDIG